MRLSAPTTALWALAVISGILGIVGHLTHVNYLTEYQFPLLLIGFALLVIGTLFKRA